MPEPENSTPSAAPTDDRIHHELKGAPMPANDIPDFSAIITKHFPTDPSAPTFTLERDLEGVIVAAAAGNQFARELLRPAVTRIARSVLIYESHVRRVTDAVLFALGDERCGPGTPLPGHATAWLETVTRTYATYDFRRSSRRQWGRWDPPPRDDGP